MEVQHLALTHMMKPQLGNTPSVIGSINDVIKTKNRVVVAFDTVSHITCTNTLSCDAYNRVAVAFGTGVPITPTTYKHTFGHDAYNRVAVASAFDSRVRHPPFVNTPSALMLTLKLL